MWTLKYRPLTSRFGQLRGERRAVAFRAVPHARDAAGHRIDHKIVDVVVGILHPKHDAAVGPAGAGMDVKSSGVVIRIAGRLESVDVESEQRNVIRQRSHRIVEFKNAHAARILVPGRAERPLPAHSR